MYAMNHANAIENPAAAVLACKLALSSPNGAGLSGSDVQDALIVPM